MAESGKKLAFKANNEIMMVLHPNRYMGSQSRMLIRGPIDISGDPYYNDGNNGSCLNYVDHYQIEKDGITTRYYRLYKGKTIQAKKFTLIDSDGGTHTVRIMGGLIVEDSYTETEF